MAETIITVVLEVVKCLAPPTERQISYFRGYSNNFLNLKKEIEKMKNDRASVQHKVDEAIRQGEDIEKNVDEWLASVKKVIAEAEEFVGNEATANKDCLKGLCPNMKTRFQLSKEAVRQLEAISKLRQAGRFGRISDRSIPEDLGLKPSKDYEPFESRKSTLKDIISALKDPDVNMLGIYGMGGIGKTTLAKEIARQAEGDKLFDQIVFAEVSRSPDIRKIQGEIADKLGLTFHEESESGRARSLCNRLKAEKRILVILDKIWEDLNLQAVGIPHEEDHKGCKVLLTARSEDALSRKMDCQQNFSVGVLEEEEAWNLFKKMVGGDIEGSRFKSVATDVAKECAGLPVSIITVARALRDKRLFEWKDALDQLRRPSSMNFKDIQSTAYSAIELSYNKLKNEELKKVFLLIGYAYETNINDLLMYAMGLGLFQGINLMEEAQARVRTVVQKLKTSCLLLDNKSEDEVWFSMHDVIRDIAISIASTKQNGLVVTNGEPFNRWESLDESAFIVLLDVKTNFLPKGLECPKVKLFYMRAAEKSLSLTIPDNFFARMIKVRVLDLTSLHLLSLPSSLHLLTNLRTLCLDYCTLKDISIVGDLKNLEILSLRGSKIKQLPVKIGQLTLLRMLNLKNYVELEVIPPNVLSKLSNLEELYIFDFNRWEVEVEEQKNASLDELRHLPNLTSLELHIGDVNTLPKGLFFEKLKRYNVCIGPNWLSWNIRTKNSAALRLQLNSNIGLKDGLVIQLKEVEELSILGLQEQDIKNFVYELVKTGSLQLKHLKVTGCSAPSPKESKRPKDLTSDIWLNEIISKDNSFFLEKVALSNLKSLFLDSIHVERIWQSQLAAMSCGIQNLKSLAIYKCRNLKILFSSSMVSSFVQLKHLNIEMCDALEEIIVMDQAERKNIMFPQLQSLSMTYLEKLTSFCIEDVHIEFSFLKELHIQMCPKFMAKSKSSNHDFTKKRLKNLTTDTWLNEIISEDDSLFLEKVALPNLEILVLRSICVERIWQSQLAAMSCGIQNLTSLIVDDCRNLKFLFSSTIVSSFIQLKCLHIGMCRALEEIIVMDQAERKNVVFPQLKSLRMTNLEKLISFCTGDVRIEFLSLKELHKENCPKFTTKYKSSNHDFTKKVCGFSNLEILKVEEKHMPWICLNEDFICKLQYLNVFLDESTYISSLDLLQRFHSFKNLKINGEIGDSITILNGMIAVIRNVNKFCDIKHVLKPSAFLNDLETLEIMNLECDNLIHLVPFSTTFQNLTTLKVLGCNGLIKLLTSSTTRNLVRLREMTIISCGTITTIVGDDAAKYEIIFRELKRLLLYNLNSLTSFFSGNCAFKFPFLEELCVEGCPSMKVFSAGELSTPNLHKVHLSWFPRNDWIWECDLNTTIKQLYLKTKKSLEEELGQPSMHHLE